MKNKRIIQAYDSINPGIEDKQRMLDAILSEAKLEDAPHKTGKTREPVVYTQKQSVKNKRRSIFSTLAAGIALVLAAGFGISYFTNHQLLDNVVVEPSTEVTIPIATAADHYAPILEKYRRSIAEGWSKEQCEIEGVSTRMQTGGDFTKTGFAFLDLDGDGREELLIAEESVPHIDNIWDLYTTLEDGTPIQLWVDEQDGGQCRLYEDNVISISYSNKHELDSTFYDLESGKLVMREMLQWEDEDTVFHTDANGNTRQVTSKEGQNIGNAYDIQKLDLTWLADIPTETEYLTGYEWYDYIVNKYVTALTENWTDEQCEQNDISPDIFSSTTISHNLGWCMSDIDKNGVEELIISDGVHLFDLYVMMPHNGTPGHLIMANGGQSYQLCEDGTIEQFVGFSKGMSRTYFELSGIDLVQKNMLYYTNSDPNNPYVAINQYSYGTGVDDLKVISKEEAGSIISSHRTVELTLTPFLDRGTFDPDDLQYYQPLLELYQTALNEDWHPAICQEKGISLMVAYRGEYYDNLGYAMMDLDGNGIEELIITDGRNIYDLFTIIQDETTSPLHLVSAMERLNYYLIQDNHIFYEGSGGAARQVYCHYALEGTELTLLEGYGFDADTDPNNPWFFHDGEEYGDSCGSFDPQPIIDSYEVAEISFIPFE